MEDQFLLTDCDSILSHLRQCQKQLKLKRRWLMGLPLTKSQERKLYSLSARAMPESILREDDVFFENVKRYVEEISGVCEADRGERITLKIGELVEINSVKRILLSGLDCLTNRGLFLVAMLLTKGCVNFEKTRKRMKKVIKEIITKSFLIENHEHGQREVYGQLYQLFSDPKNFREGHSTSFIPSIHAHYPVAVKLLDNLEDFSTETLLAMQRKLRGVPAGISFSKRKRYGWKREDLIHRIRRTGKGMLSKHHGENGLPAPLAEALTVAGLSRKLDADCFDSSVTEFIQFSPETKAVQNQIIKAIRSLKTKVRFPKLNTLKILFDSKADIPGRCLRSALKRLLIQYLFECSELDTVPKPISEALSIINRSSQTMHRECNLDDENEKEVECILSLSADIKQIVWDDLPLQDIDEDFANAYTEELEESDDDDFDHDSLFVGNVNQEAGDSQISKSFSLDSEYQEESTGEFIPMNFQTLISTPEKNHNPSLFYETRNLDGMVNVDINDFEMKSVEESCTLRGNSDTCNNRYLDIQEICDDSSMVAYNLIGCIMEGMAEDEEIDLEMGHSSYLQGDYSAKNVQERTRVAFKGVLAGSFILKVAEHLVPSLPKSSITKLKELIGS